MAITAHAHVYDDVNLHRVTPPVSKVSISEGTGFVVTNLSAFPVRVVLPEVLQAGSVELVAAGATVAVPFQPVVGVHDYSVEVVRGLDSAGKEITTQAIGNSFPKIIVIP